MSKINCPICNALISKKNLFKHQKTKKCMNLTNNIYGYIYKLFCLDTREMYIGSTTNLKNRINSHQKKDCVSKQIINRGNYIFLILQEGYYINHDHLLAIEDSYIQKLPCINTKRAFTTDNEYSKNFYWNNLELAKKRMKEYKNNNLEKFKINQKISRKKTYDKNRDKYLKQKKEYGEKNKDKIKIRNKNWYQANKDKVLLERKQIKNICDCGAVIGYGFNQHLKTKKHFDNLLKLGKLSAN